MTSRLLSMIGRSNLTTGIVAYCLSTATVVIGVLFGRECIEIPEKKASGSRPSVLTACSRFDGNHYKEIVDNGYSYDPTKRSLVAFFPGYPLLGKLVVQLTNWPTALALLVLSNVMLVGMFTAMAVFLQARWPGASPTDRHLVLALLGVFPATFFFRMAYSESTFLFGLAIFLNGTVRRWPSLPLALVAGAVTAIRPVGVACTAAFAWHILSDDRRGTVGRRLRLASLYVPLACWGLLAYMGYQQMAFGNPLAFAQTQDNWRYASPDENEFEDKSDRWWDKADSLLTAEPILSVFDSESRRYWARGNRFDCPLFNMFFWNPIVFVGAFVLVVFGWYRQWLTGVETVLGLALLAIPYLTRSYEMSMASHARFAAAVIPAYMVAGRLMRSLPQWAIWAVFALFSTVLMLWTALFVGIGSTFF